MDERWRVLLVVLGTGLGAALLGALFGGLTGMLHWRAGKATGGWFGLRVLAALEEAGESEFSPTFKGILVGAVDGLLFLGTLGAVIGLVIVLWHPGREAILGTGLLAVAFLMFGAVGFGLLAYCLVRAGSRGIGGPLALALAGSYLGFRFFGLTGLLLGCMAGLVGGALLTLFFFAPPPSRRR
jgi:hypothetical protein